MISLPLVFWGQNARGYALLVTLSVGSFLALIAILQTPAGQRARRAARVAGYVLTTLAALYVGYDVGAADPGPAGAAALFRERARVVIGCLALVLVLCVPLLVLAAERGSGQLFWVTPFSWPIAGQAALTLLSAGMPPNFHSTSTTIAAAVVIGRGVLSRRSSLAARAALPRAAAPAASGPLLLVLLAGASSRPWSRCCCTRLGEPIELARVTILVMPALALLLAWVLLRPGVTAGARRGRRGCAAGAAAAQLLPSYGVSPEPWNAVTAYVLSSTPADQPACVVFYPQDGREPFDYYLRALAGGGANPAPSLRPILPSARLGHGQAVRRGATARSMRAG